MRAFNPKFLCYSIKAPIVLSDGRVTTCTLDHEGRNAFANIYRQSFDEVIAQYAALRISAMEDPEARAMCQSCYANLPRWQAREIPRAGWIRDEFSDVDKERFLALFDPNNVTMNIELSSKCNLRCSGCGVAKPYFRATRDQANIDMDRLIAWVGEAGSRIKQVRLYHMGETWAHPRWAEAVHAIRGQNPETSLFTSTNGMPMLENGVLDVLPDAPLDHIMFSMHGARQESAQRYMGKAFDLTKAMSAARRTAEIRDKHGLDIYLSWKYLLFSWNDSEEEIAQAKQLAEDIGFDEIHFTITSQPSPSRRFASSSAAWQDLRAQCALSSPHSAQYQAVTPMSALWPCSRQRTNIANGAMVEIGEDVEPNPPVQVSPPVPPISPLTPVASADGGADVLRMGRDLLKAGMVREAADLLRGAEKQGLDTAALHQSLGDCHLALRELGPAIKHYARSVELAGKSSSEFLLAAQARALRLDGQLVAAREAYERAVRARASTGGRAYGEDLFLAQSQTYTALGDLDKADIAWGRWLESYYLADHEKRLVYCPIAKNACTYLKTALVANSAKAEDFSASKKDAHVYTRAPGSGFHLANRRLIGHGRYFSFVVLRDPFKRAVSAYANLFVRPLRWRPIPDLPAQEAVYEYAARHRQEPDLLTSLTFEQFVDHVCHVSDADLDHHFRSQAAFIANDLTPFDFVGRCEDMAQLEAALKNKAGWSFAPLARANVTEYASDGVHGGAEKEFPGHLVKLKAMPPPEAFLSDSVRARLAERYAQDFDHYHARFGIELRPVRGLVTVMKAEDREAPLYPTPGALLAAGTGDERHEATSKVAVPIIEKAPAVPISTLKRPTDGRRFNPSIAPASGASVPSEAEFDITITIEPGESSAFRKGLAQAFSAQKEGRSARVVLAPGIHRTSAKADGNGNPSAMVSIEAQTPGTAVICGSDVLKTPAPLAEGVWQMPWPYRFDVAAAPPSYGDPYLEVGELMRRREMILFDGRLLRQVLTLEELAEGTFHVGDDTGLLTICAVRRDPNIEPLVEAASRSGLLHLAGCENVLIKGIVFQHDNSTYPTPQTAALQLSRCRNVLVEDCLFSLNNNKGIQIDGSGSEAMTLRRVRSDRNGCLGLLVTRCGNLLIEDCETSFNNWRGGWAGWRRASPCGFKIMHSDRVTLRRHRSLHNDATGGWLDEDVTNAIIEDSLFYGNRRGLHIEATLGPVIVRRTSVISNRVEPVADEWRWTFGSGLVLTHASSVLITNCTLADNDVAQFGIRDDRETRTLKSPAAQADTVRRSEQISLVGNRILASSPARAFVHAPELGFDGGHFWDSFFAAANVYSAPPGLTGFVIGPLSRRRAEGPLTTQTLHFDQWQKALHCDRDGELHDI